MMLASIYRKLNLLSIDVALGAVAGGIMASGVTGCAPEWGYWVVLPLSVWLVYTADHIIDGLNASPPLLHERHLFHRRNMKALIIAGIPLALLTAFFAFSTLPGRMIIYGLVLGLLILAYLGLVMSISRGSPRALQKELLVALFYTAGIWGPLYVMQTEHSTYEWLIMLIFFMLAFADLLLLSILELGRDSQEGEPSFPGNYGPEVAKRLFQFISILALSGAAFVMLTGQDPLHRKASLLLGIMDILLIFIFELYEGSKKELGFRYFSELVFLVPALMLLWY